MAQLAKNVTAGSPRVAGGILTAPQGGAQPTDAVSDLPAAYEALGYAADSGLESSGEGASISDIKAWGGDIVASVVESKSITKFKFTLLEVFSETVAKLVFGEDNVTATAAGDGRGSRLAIKDRGDNPPIRSYVFDMLYKGKRMRIAVPVGSLVVTQELSWVDAELTGYECEVTCLPDADGVRTYRYFENDDVAA